ILQQSRSHDTLVVSYELVKACQALLQDDTLHQDFVAQCFDLPSLQLLAEKVDVIDVKALHKAQTTLKVHLAKALEKDFLKKYETHHQKQKGKDYIFHTEAMGQRRLKNMSLYYLMQANPGH